VTYLLDINVISEARKRHGHPAVKAWLAATPAETLYLSVLVVGEVRRGVERLRRRDPAQAAAFDAWLGTLHRDFAGSRPRSPASGGA
jgi:hypothetical protein